MDDHSVWARIADDDVNALRTLHDKYFHSLWLWAVKNTRNESLAEELVSDCFIKLWDGRRKIIITKSLKSYLFLMLRNQIVSHARKSKHEFVFGDGNLPDLPDEDELNSQDFYSELYAAIHKIPEQRRKILELAVFESQSYKEIAALLGISINTVKTQMGRAYQFLKEELDPKNFLLFHFFLKVKKQN
ncbi:MAG: sigma-70 family RNA polymerase sigma factor [Prolixibacteraceae bacterium]|jgi:RNA polymerase sigma-70 factor (ECF subfamily)